MVPIQVQLIFDISRKCPLLFCDLLSLNVFKHFTLFTFVSAVLYLHLSTVVIIISGNGLLPLSWYHAFNNVLIRFMSDPCFYIIYILLSCAHFFVVGLRISIGYFILFYYIISFLHVCILFQCLLRFILKRIWWILELHTTIVRLLWVCTLKNKIFSYYTVVRFVRYLDIFEKINIWKIEFTLIRCVD
jgi:hypothetical protein